MTVELKIFGGALFAKDKALKENPELKNLAIFVNAPNKSVAEAIIAGKVAEHYPANMSDYFKAKVWVHREELPFVEPGAFSTDFFDTVAVWNATTNEPAAAQPACDEKGEWEENAAAEELKTVSKLDQHSRAACLALFGPVREITMPEYGQVIDLINDDEGSFTRELTEALSKEPRTLALEPVRQLQLLEWVREKSKDTAQWTDIKKLIVQWLDTPLDKRPQAADSTRTNSGATLGGGNKTDRSPDLVHNLSTLGIEIAVALLSMYDEIDIYSIPSRFLSPAKGMAEAERDPVYTSWWDLLRSTPGILDYSRAAIIAMIKSAPGDLWLEPIKMREYINRTLVESNHAKPDPQTINIACSPRPRTPQKESKNDEAKPPLSGEDLPPANSPKSDAEFNADIDRALAAREAHQQSQSADQQPSIQKMGEGLYSIDALMGENASNRSDNEEAPIDCNRLVLSSREIEIAYALNDLISGHTDIMSKDEAEGVVAATGQTVSQTIPLLMADITTVEFCLSPEFSDEEIHDVVTTILDAWSDDCHVRQKIATDAIVEYRKPTPPRPIMPVPAPEPEPAQQQTVTLDSPPLTYRQQLTVAALQGMCANPAYRGEFYELHNMVTMLVDNVLAQDSI